MTDDELREALLRLRGVAEGGVPEGAEDELLLVDVLDALADRVVGHPGRAAFQMRDDVPHRLEVQGGDWGLTHPMSCRPDLLGCPVHVAAAKQMRDDPLSLGEYDVGVSDEGELRVLADIG